jgi:hypothetical protein
LTHRDIEASWIAADASLTLPWDKLIELALTKSLLIKGFEGDPDVIASIWSSCGVSPLGWQGSLVRG